jgi:hypothetical protein
MGFTYEWHLRAPQAVTLELLQYYWWERGCEVEIEELPQDDQAWVAWWNTARGERLEELRLVDHSLVSATDDGWTVVWPVWSPWNPGLWQQLSWEAHAPLLVG